MGEDEVEPEEPGDDIDPELKKLAVTTKKSADKIAEADEVDRPDSPRDGKTRLEESRG